LVLALSANAVQSAPLGLATTISISTALAGPALGVTTVATTKLLAMTTLQKIAITATITAAVGVAIYQTRQGSQAREQLRIAQQSEQPLKDEVRRLSEERDDAARQLTAAREQNESLRANLEGLPKLRGEVARLRESGRELAQLKAVADTTGSDPGLDNAFKTWAVRATRLRQRLEQATDQRIPEMQFLTEKGWFDAVKELKQLETENDYQQAASNLRNIAKGEFVRLMQNALRAYTDANQGQLPQDLAQLKPFFGQPVDDSLLQRYKLLQTGSLADVPKSEYLVADIAPLVDEEHDATFKFSINGINSHTGDPVEDAVKEAGIQFAQAHDGLLPTDPSQLTPYLKKPLDPQKIQRVLSKIPPGVTTLQQLKAAMSEAF